MRLLSATVRNYRIHSDLSVEFDPSRTLIGGPNEVGKSTLVEAIHRGLFMKSRVTGEAQKSMMSVGAAGHPEVEVTFEAAGACYNLVKRFSGSSGSTRLAQVGGGNWQGDEAETRLLALLGVEDVGKGRGLAERVAQQWSHLWVWQGMSGADPSEHASSQHANLLHRLQSQGGSVALQSENDSRIARQFAEIVEVTFTQGANPRAKRGSRLDMALVETAAAEEVRAQCAERVQRLRQAMADSESSPATIERTTESLRTLLQQSEEVEGKRRLVDELRQDAEKRKQAVETAVERFTALDKVESQIAKLRRRMAATSEALAPRKQELSTAETALRIGQKRAEVAQKDFERMEGALRIARLKHELADALIRRFEKIQLLTETEHQAKEAKAARRARETLREELAKLPMIERKQLQGLQKLESQLIQARAALGAMAAGIELIAGDVEVTADHEALQPGKTYTVTEPTEITVGPTVRLRIEPGGGKSLSEARQLVRALQEKLQKALDTHGIEHVEAAATIAAKRADLESKLEQADAHLERMKASTISEKLADAREGKSGADSVVERKRAQLEGITLPSDQPAAAQWLASCESALADSERDLARLRAVRDLAGNEQQSLADILAKLNESLAARTGELSNLDAQLRLMLENHGPDAQRLEALSAARDAKDAAARALESTTGKLAGMQPDLIASDQERLKRARAQAEQERRDAETANAVARAALHSDGRENPETALALAEARVEGAHAHLASVQRQANAIRLLHTLFQEEQRAMADQFTRPLALKVSGYLQSLFGPETEARVSLIDDAFTGIQLARGPNGMAIDFQALSGGTREQAAAAVRLAIAEVLAADHDLCLPLIFDDAFAYSDPERVQTLQRMLDLAANRGLQIIVLTCHPGAYAALGARHVSLTSRRA